MTKVGDRIQLVALVEPTDSLQPGAVGRVIWIEDDGLVHVTWEAPLDAPWDAQRAAVALEPGRDEWTIIEG